MLIDLVIRELQGPGAPQLFFCPDWLRSRFWNKRLVIERLAWAHQALGQSKSKPQRSHQHTPLPPSYSFPPPFLIFLFSFLCCFLDLIALIFHSLPFPASFPCFLCHLYSDLYFKFFPSIICSSVLPCLPWSTPSSSSSPPHPTSFFSPFPFSCSTLYCFLSFLFFFLTFLFFAQLFSFPSSLFLMSSSPLSSLLSYLAGLSRLSHFSATENSKDFFVRGWDKRKTSCIIWGRPHSQTVSSSEFVEADEKHSWKCETFRWGLLTLGLFKRSQCSAEAWSFCGGWAIVNGLLTQSASVVCAVVSDLL